MTRSILLIALLTLPLSARAETQKIWSASFGAEASFDRVESESGRNGAYKFTVAPSIEIAPEWSLGAETEVEFETKRDDQRNDVWRDTTLALTQSVEWVQPFEWSALVLLPTNREEQESGLHAAPGIGLATKLPISSVVSAGYEAKGHRMIRNSEKAQDADRWRFEHAFDVKFRLASPLTLKLAAKDEHSWLWTGGREESFELKEVLEYQVQNYKIGFGHKSKTSVRNADGSRAVFALLDNSEVFGTVGIAL